MLKVLQNIRAYFLALAKASMYIKIAKSKIGNRGNSEGEAGEALKEAKETLRETSRNTRGDCRK